MTRKSKVNSIEQARATYEERVLNLTLVRYDPANDEFDLTLSSGIRIAVPRSVIPSFDVATRQQLRAVYPGNGGATLSLDAFDIDVFVPGLLDRLFGRTIRAERGRRSGIVSSPQKIAAARRNGQKGGRPRSKSAA